MDHSDIDDFMSFVGFSDEDIACAKELLNSSPYETGTWYVRDEGGSSREPSAILYERKRQ